ncbi:helix-turn-helix domain-containing protein [Amycolatopsis jiangsuensis]|uniref:Transcriptional regulator with XRE-family HTH domain n=1 Tax=Amycolatopsis jiangsuensis TaxID=1181879 RepID=A0A840J450_9PSEU|nr:helix-turn-helix transcriptional regulator [Amycolatopsis jiangsuensis]MBB4689841.1 transcriptional regulator with XRE-family HTH domain [Amycolatopsis jiangsuensis]
MHEATPELGAALRAARKNAHWGVRELARRVGVHPAVISSWELGHRTPKPLDVAGILGALGVVGEQRQWILRMALTADLDRSLPGG